MIKTFCRKLISTDFCLDGPPKPLKPYAETAFGNWFSSEKWALTKLPLRKFQFSSHNFASLIYWELKAVNYFGLSRQKPIDEGSHLMDTKEKIYTNENASTAVIEPSPETAEAPATTTQERLGGLMMIGVGAVLMAALGTGGVGLSAGVSCMTVGFMLISGKMKKNS